MNFKLTALLLIAFSTTCIFSCTHKGSDIEACKKRFGPYFNKVAVYAGADNTTAATLIQMEYSLLCTDSTDDAAEDYLTQLRAQIKDGHTAPHPININVHGMQPTQDAGL